LELDFALEDKSADGFCEGGDGVVERGINKLNGKLIKSASHFCCL
jgi:hypothetical protein